MNLQIQPELLLLLKMHKNVVVRYGLLGNGSHSGLCQRTEVWTSSICLQFNCISLPCLLRNATHITDLSKLFSIPGFPLIIIYHFPELIRIKEQVMWLYKGFWVALAFAFVLFTTPFTVWHFIIIPSTGYFYVWPLNNPFSLKCSPPFTSICKNKFGGT